MAGTTVIDQLIVKLGLDPRDFSKGEKQAAQDTVKLENQVKKSSDNMGRSMLGFTGKVLGLATVAIAVKKFIGYTSDLSASIRQLGIDSANFHIAASELRNFGNVAEMMGGKAEDVTKTVGGLAKSIYDLAYNGQISDSLVMLGRLGVQFQDSTGNMRDFKSITLDTQSAIQRSMQNGTSRANAYQMLLQAGFDPGLANAMLKGDVGQQLARQEQRRQVNKGDIDLMTAREQSADNLSQATDAASLGNAIVRGKIKGETALYNKGAEVLDKAGTTEVNEIISNFGNVIKDAGSAVKDFILGLEQRADNMTAKNMPRGRAAYEDTIQAVAKKYNINPEMLAGLLQTESNFNPSAVNSKSGATGIAQLMPKYFPGAGKNPHKDIDTAGEYLRKLHDAHVQKGDADDDGAWYLALQSYNAGQTRVRKSMQGGKPLTQETQDYPGKVLGYAEGAVPTPNAQNGGTNNRTDITFEQVTIQTPRTDGEAVAGEFVDATKRKLMAAQAETGLR